MAVADDAKTPIRNYESVIIVHPDASEQDQKTLLKKNRDIIKSFDGELNHVDTWGSRKLANPIDKKRRGVYFHTTFTARGEAVKELERTMRINDKVMRFMHTRLDDRSSLSQHLDQFKDILVASNKREHEREAKMQARKAAFKKRRD